MNRSTTLFLLLTCPLLACGDDALPPVPEDTTGEDSTGGPPPVTVTVNPPTVTDTDPGETGDTTATTGDPDTSTTTDDPDTTATTDEMTSSTTAGEESTSSGGGAVCGDDMAEAPEECDSDDLAGQTCDSLGMGFTGGTLSCAGDCTFDVSACTTCGNDMIEGAEECDGVDLAGQTCMSLGMGFADGVLACDAACTYDVSGCTTCGNDMIDGIEECDGVDLGGETCVSQGFAGGTLGCMGCAFDTTGCTTCGNGVIDPGEDCDGADLGGSGCVDMGMGFTGGALGCDAACGYDTAACTSVPWPVAGEVIITEIMQNPQILPDSDGEFFEVYNTTLADLQLGNCVIEGSTDMGFTIDTDMVIGPLSYRTFATDSVGGPGFVPDFSWDGALFSLNNASDTVRVVCNGVNVDEVNYDDGATFPDPNGASMNLSFDSYDGAANDVGANWCESTMAFNGDFGTPGADNTVCMAPVTYPIDFCRLQFPTLIDEIQGTNVDVFGRLYIAGLTDLSGVNDPAPEVIGYVGYGPDGTDPAIDPGWVWTAGVPNAGYGPASPGYEANNDEYQGVLTVPVPGTYDFAFRFSGDGGTTFTYCDNGVAGAGSSDGYAPADAGQMTAQPGGAPPDLYFSEYAEGSSNNKAIEIFNAGTDADLTACEVRFYFNGLVAIGNTINLGGVLAAGDVLVVCDDGIDPLVYDPANCDVLDGGSFFNGDDAIELVCSGTTLDVIGQIGFDPGAEWLVGGVGTQDETLRRSCAVTAGDPNGADAFDPSLEWASFMQNDFSDFGQYVCP